MKHPTPDSIHEIKFWNLVKKVPNGCWLWLGSTVWGYGQFHWPNKSTRAHRIAYELIKGSIPRGLTLDHLCRVRACVNPDHLEAVTLRVNILRGVGLTAKNAAKEFCYKGHSYSDESNVLKDKAGRRVCRACRRLRYKKHYDKNAKEIQARRKARIA